MDNDFGFCIHCGATLPAGAEHCPECGMPLFEERPSARYAGVRSSSLTFFMVMLAIYGGYSIIEGIMDTLFNSLMMDGIRTIYGDRLQEYLSGMGVESLSQFSDIVYKEGIVNIIDGAMVMSAFLLCYLRKYWKLAVALCILASGFIFAALPFMTGKLIESNALMLILQAAVGLLVARGIYVNRAVFK